MYVRYRCFVSPGLLGKIGIFAPSSALLRSHPKGFEAGFLPPHKLKFSSRSGPAKPDSIVRSSSALLAAALLAGLASSLVLSLSYFSGGKDKATEESKCVDISKEKVARSLDAALLPVMQSNIQPGRVGALTPEQEGKLREFWQTTLQVFGTWETTPPDEDGTAAPLADRSPTTPEKGGKKRKSRLSLFGKRHRENNNNNKDVESEADASVIPDEEDKHGLNKGYRQALSQQTPEELRKTFWSMVKHDHPDSLLLRFLRARKWDVQQALVMLVSTMHWRSQEMHVDDDVVRSGEGGALEATKSADLRTRKEGEDFMAQMRMGKSFLHGVDKEGRPICLVRVRLHRQGDQTESSLERYTVYTIETARLMLRPPVDTATIVFDMTDFSLANMDYTPVKFMIKCFEANYPESLGAVLVHKAPWIFQSIWTIIRGWLDPVVAGKVHFTKTVEELCTFVPRSNIIKELGGDEDWEYRYLEPSSEENKQMADTVTRDKLLTERAELVSQYENATVEWLRANGEMVEFEERRGKVADELRQNYWALDPYVRARTLYDRQGILQQGGGLNFYPAATASGPSGNETSVEDLD